MARVCCILILALALVLSDSKAIDPYSTTEQLLAEYSPRSTNLTSLLRLLDESADRNNPEALMKLGELYLFGLPVSPEHPDYMYDYPLKRDFAKAVKYFRKAKHLGAKDAAFYLSFLLHQSLFTEELDKKVPIASDFLYSHSGMEKDGLKAGSELTMLSVASGYRQCAGAENFPVPEFLSANFSTALHAFPYLDEDAKCRRSCSSSVEFALKVANSSMETYQRTGTFPSYDLGPLHLVMEEVRRHSPEKTLALLQSHAGVGDQEAVAVLADAYYHGSTALALSANVTLAVGFYEQTADKGDVNAMEKLGAIYSKGAAKNATRALKYLQKAAEAGSVKAHYGLGFLYLDGEGVKKNVTAALEHFHYAADHGSVESQNFLSSLYFSGQIVKKDLKRGMEYLLKAVQVGHFPALYTLGQMLMDGTHVMRSCENALNLLWLVALQGESSRYMRQGYYFVKFGDYEGAYLSFALAAALGYESGQLSAGYMWEKGLVPLTCKYGKEFCAASYYAMAATLTNNSWAAYRLGDIAYYGSERFAPEPETAFKFYSLSRGLPEARFSLAYMHENGVGVNRNSSAAKDLYEGLLEDADLGLVPGDVKYPAYLALARLKAEEYFTHALEWASLAVTTGTLRML